jgi:lipooligosaccharide transport system permease protein
MQGTYRAIIATPVSVDDVITGEILWGTTRSVINASYILLVAIVLTPWLGMIDSPLALFIVPAAVLPGVLFSAISICFASIARAMSQFSYFFNLIVNPMFWFGGAFFPIEELPGWAQTIAWFIPLTHVVSLYRGLVTGDLAWSHLGDLAWVVVAAGFFYLLALVSMRRRLIE